MSECPLLRVKRTSTNLPTIYQPRLVQGTSEGACLATMESYIAADKTDKKSTRFSDEVILPRPECSLRCSSN